MTIAGLDLQTLPPAEIIEPLNYDAILAEYVELFNSRFPDYNVGALETDPVKIALEVGAYRELLLRARMNDVARANLLYYATGGDLDQLAAFYDVTRLLNETDVRFRDRVVLAISGRSTGGTVERYKFVALSADVNIRDVAVWRKNPSPVIGVSVLNTLNDGVAYPEMLTSVMAALTDPAVQMVNDQFAIESAVTTTVNVTANVWLLPSTLQSTFVELPEALRAKWIEEGGLGRDLTKAWLVSRLMQAGIQKVELLTPSADTVVNFHQAVALGTVTLNYMGRAY
jgi:phage-related baseplate assembly protein